MGEWIACLLSVFVLPCSKYRLTVAFLHLDAPHQAVNGSTLVSADPNASKLCFGATIPTSTPQAEQTIHRSLQSNPQQGGGTGALSNCSSPAAQFAISASTSTPGTVVHKASGLCLTVGRCAASPPPAPTRSLPSGTHPCDIYESTGNACVAAHGMTRALFAAYEGALYSVLRASDNATQNISVKVAGGYANTGLQDTFCAGTWCTVDKIYDQTPNGNHLGIFGPDKGVNASQDKHRIGGHDVYSANFSKPGLGYRNINKTSANSTCAGPGVCTGPGVSIAVGEEAESMYMVVSGKHFNNHCCFDYGNAERNAHDNGDGTMESLYFGSDEAWWRERPANKTGPWIMADIENGMYAGDDNIDPDAVRTWGIDYVTAMLKGRHCQIVLKGGNAQEGLLTTLYDGVRPQHNLYQPMRKEGGIILGTGGDNSRGAVGTWFEGAMVSGFVSKETEDAIQKNIVAAGYGKSSTDPHGSDNVLIH